MLIWKKSQWDCNFCCKVPQYYTTLSSNCKHTAQCTQMCVWSLEIVCHKWAFPLSLQQWDLGNLKRRRIINLIYWNPYILKSYSFTLISTINWVYVDAYAGIELCFRWTRQKSQSFTFMKRKNFIQLDGKNRDGN